MDMLHCRIASPNKINQLGYKKTVILLPTMTMKKMYFQFLESVERAFAVRLCNSSRYVKCTEHGLVVIKAYFTTFITVVSRRNFCQ